eukprot:6212671-Pleurochrysis_carterae.AAC.2
MQELGQTCDSVCQTAAPGNVAATKQRTGSSCSISQRAAGANRTRLPLPVLKSNSAVGVANKKIKLPLSVGARPRRPK